MYIYIHVFINSRNFPTLGMSPRKGRTGPYCALGAAHPGTALPAARPPSATQPTYFIFIYVYCYVCIYIYMYVYVYICICIYM